MRPPAIRSMRTTARPAEVTVATRDPAERTNPESFGSDATTSRPTTGNQNSLVIGSSDSGGLEVRRPAGSDVRPSPSGSQARVDNESDARFRESEQGEVKATATVIGDPLLVAKATVEILGLEQLSGIFYVEKAVHEINQGGYVTKLSLLKNAMTSMPTSDPPTLDGANANPNDQTVPPDRRLTIRPDGSGGLVQER